MCYNYLLKTIDFINERKKRETPIENNASDLLFLKKKRKFEQPFLDSQWNDMTPKKEIDFSFLKPIDAKSETNGFSSDPNRLPNCNSSTEFSFDYNNKKQNSQCKLSDQIEELIKIKINSNNDNKKIDLEENNLDFHNKFFNNEKNNVVKNSERSELKNVGETLFSYFNCDKINDKGNNKSSGTKVMMNNKFVYSNCKGTNLYLYSNNIQQTKETFLINAGRRRSKYRGVSKNGNQWQVLLMANKSKSYVGTYTNEDIAARVYDILSIKYRGDKAKTNFIYSESQIRKIFNTDIDVKANNLNEIISDLLKDN